MRLVCMVNSKKVGEGKGDDFFTHYLARRSEMLGISLENTYRALRDIGLVKSQRDYCRRFLSRGPGYLKEFRREGRDMVKVSAVTVATLRSRLCAIAARVPAGVAAEVMAVVESIDHATMIYRLLAR